MPGRPFSRFALAAATALMLDAGTVRAELPGDPDPTFTRARIRKIGKLLASKKAERELGAEARATLAAEADALATEVEAMMAAGS